MFSMKTSKTQSTPIKELQSCDTSPIFEHCRAMCHNINLHIKVLSDENNTIKRRVRDAIAIKKRKPFLNRDEGLNLIAIKNFLLGIRNNFSVTQPNTSQR